MKSALYDAGSREELLLSITVDHTGDSGGRLKIADPNGNILFESAGNCRDVNAGLEAMFAWLGEHRFLSGLAAVGHRLVQGGPRHKEPLQINSEFLREIEQLIPLDPDHLPAAIEGIKFIARKFPELPQVACFDTAFHSSIPRVASMYALPRRLYDQGILRYGFHGLSYEYVMGELQSLEGKLADGRVIIAHLGSGASMVAVKNGKSIDTSMGFTPLEGLVMATRSGDVDPGALLYLSEYKKMSAKEINTLVNKQSGLLGVSETSSDMKVLLDNASRDPRAGQALDSFCYRAKKYIGAYLAAMNGADALIFTGGIGENSPEIRAQICADLENLGIALDPAENTSRSREDRQIGKSAIPVWVVPTEEELLIARDTLRCILGIAHE